MWRKSLIIFGCFALNFCFKFTRFNQLRKLFTNSLFFFWIYIIGSHFFFFFSGAALTDISRIFFHPLVFLFLPNNRIKFVMTYFHVNQCLGYKSFNAIEFPFSQNNAFSFCFLLYLVMIQTPLLLALKTITILYM